MMHGGPSNQSAGPRPNFDPTNGFSAPGIEEGKNWARVHHAAVISIILVGEDDESPPDDLELTWLPLVFSSSMESSDEPL